MEVTRTVRYLRSEVQLPPGKRCGVIIKADSESSLQTLAAEETVLQKLAGLEKLTVLRELPEQQTGAGSGSR